MNFYATHYRSGEGIKPGDRISYAGRPGTVVFVLGQPGIPAEWAKPEDWIGNPNAEGFMLDTELTGLVFQSESDEDLDFLERKQ